METAILLSAFLLFLFSVYLFSREDYTFERKNVSLEHVFNLTFIGFLVGIFTARVFFIIFHWRFAYTNPLVFLLFPYFPGLSLAGGIIGFLLFLWIITIQGKIPLGRIFDIFIVSFFIAYSVSKAILFLILSLLTRHISLVQILTLAASIIGCVLIVLFLRTNRWKDGVIGLLGMIVFSISLFTADLLSLKYANIFSLRDDLLYLVIIMVSIILVISRSNAFDKSKKI